MKNRVFSSRFERAGALAAGMLVCLVVVAAMFAAPHAKEGPYLFSADGPAQILAHPGEFRFTAENILGLFVIGLVSGTFGGMLGMGGGVLKMSFLLLFFGFHPGVSRFAALLSYFVVAVGASYRYFKLNLLMMEVVKILIPWSIVGIIFGAIVGHYLSRDLLTLLLGVFLLCVSVAMVRRVLLHYPGVLSTFDGVAAESGQTDGLSGGSLEPPAPGWKLALCGFPGGFLSAMLGISGGVVSNPLQQVLAHIPIKSAIANTLAMASVTVPFACLMIMVMGLGAGHFDFWQPVLVALFLIPGSLIGSQLGPALTMRMPSVAVHALFGAVALLMGIDLLFFSSGKS